MMHLFAAGELLRDPERCTAKSGNDYASALIRVDSDTVVNVVAFDTDLVDRLLVLEKDDPLRALCDCHAADGRPGPGNRGETPCAT